MEAWMWVAIGAVVLIAAAAAVYFGYVQTRRRRLREGFGPEYDRAVAEAPTRREAESELAERRKRRKEIDVRPLAPGARDRYLREWEDVQARFVDEPEGAIRDADRLIQQVMHDRGYPVEDFDSRAADLSVDYADFVDDYRRGHAIAERAEAGEATTEDLRQALVQYRSLFEHLLETADEKEEARR